MNRAAKGCFTLHLLCEYLTLIWNFIFAWCEEMAGEEKKLSSSTSKKSPISTAKKKQNTQQELSNSYSSIFQLISEKYDVFWKWGTVILLFFNLILTLTLISKLNDLKYRELLQLWGVDNASYLQSIYQDPAYQHYFKNEIDLLEKKLNQFKTTIQAE